MDNQEPAPEGQGRTRPPYGRVILVLVLVAGFAAAYAAGIQDYVSLETLRTHRQALRAAVSDNLLLALGSYIGAYALVTAFSVPGGLLMTIAGGFLFGLWLGALGAVIGATAGAIAVFLVARYALYDLMRARAGSAARRMEAGFREDALSYMFALRLVPLFPFWLVNIVPALLGVSLRVYAVGTLFGIIPGTFVYAWVGTGLDEIFARGGNVDTGIIFAPEVLGPILGLAALALLPIVYKRLRQRGGHKSVG